MKRINRLTIAVLWLVFAISLALEAGPNTFYVSPAGNDLTGDGSIGNPWASVVKARDYIRSSRANTNLQADLTVYLRGGRYELSQTLTFTNVDSGTNGYYVNYRSYSNEVVTISGGKAVTNWTQVPGKPYWVSSVPTNAGYAGYFRQLYVNGIRAERAHSDWITGVSLFNDPATPQSVDGIAFQASDLKKYSNVTDLRLLHVSSFKVDEIPVTGITTNSTNGLIQVALQQPYCQTRYDYDSGNRFRANDPWMVVQAFEELDEPGEWYLNRATQQVYYYPYSYETNLNSIPIYAPVVETLVSLTGNGATMAAKVQNIRFQGLIFEHGNWFFPRDYFIGGTQAEILFPGVATNATGLDYGFEMPGQIVLNNTAGIQFIGDTFRHFGNCGIQPFNGTLNTLIQGNLFYDLTGAAVIGGRWGADAAIPNQQICTNTVVVNNLIRDTGSDFMASTLIDNLSHYGFQVIHNDMADAQYAGFHQRNYAVGLASSAGTGGTVVSSNRIAMGNSAARYGVGDSGCLYSFGVWPNSTFLGNDINGINYANGTSRGMMFDNNSYGLTAVSNIVRNVAPGSTGYLLYTSLAGYLNSSIENYGDATVNNFAGVMNFNFHQFPLGSLPAGAQPIVNGAGLEAGYTNLLQFMYAGVNLTSGKATTASSRYSSATASGAAVDDWNFGSVWQPAANDTNQCWWTVDLGAAYAIQRIELSPNSAVNQPDARCNFQVQGANDPGFTNVTVLSEQNAVPFPYETSTNADYLGMANSWVKYVNNSQGFRYLRVIKTAPGTLSISEFQLFGYLTDTNPPSPLPLDLWTGGSGTWDVNNSGNAIWEKTNSASTYYVEGDAVVFDNTVGSGGTVTLNTNVNPYSVTVNNPTADYIISGSGVIDGFTGLTKTGAGKLTLTTTNSYAGATTINGGTLQIGNGSIDGSIASTFTILNYGALIFDLSGNQVNGMVIGGNGTLTKSGAGILTLTGSSTFTGTTTISGGTLLLAPPVIYGTVLNSSTNIIIQYGGTLAMTNRTALAGTSLLQVQNGGTLAVSYGAPVVGYVQFDTGAMLNFTNFLATAGLYVYAVDGARNAVVMGSVNVPASSLNGLILYPATSGATTTQTVQFDGTGTGATVSQFILQNGYTSSGGINNINFDIARSPSATVDMNIALLNTQADGTRTRRITKQGAGILQVDGAIPANGVNYDLVVNGGTMVFSNTANFKSLTVNSSGTLGGVGPIGNTTTVYSGGIISPGIPASRIRTLTLTNLTMNSGAMAIFELNKAGSPATNDYLVVTATQSITGSTLTVSNLGPALVAGDRFKLLSQPTSGFITVNLPGGYTWTNNLAVDGSIQVLAVPSVTPSPTDITCIVSDNQLVLNWPAGQGWLLQVQTNTLGAGLTTNWFDAAGVTPPYTNTINPANPALFYRLKF